MVCAASTWVSLGKPSHIPLKHRYIDGYGWICFLAEYELDETADGDLSVDASSAHCDLRCCRDFLNRAAWFDTVMADSIPVVFDPIYAKTLPFGNLIDYDRLMQTIPVDKIMGKNASNAIDLLLDVFDVDRALDQLRYIWEVKHVFQYMLNPRHELIRFDQLDQIASEDDAFTMSMKAALSNLCFRGLLPAARCKVKFD